MMFLQDKKQLLQWCGWFFLGNILLFLLIGLNYLPAVPIDLTYVTFKEKLSFFVFAGIAYLGQLTALTFTLALVPIFLIIFFPVRRVVFLSAFLITTGIIIFLIIDTVIYKLFRFHINGVMTEFIFQGIAQDVLGLSRIEILGLILGPCLIYLVEWIYGAWVWRRVMNTRNYDRCLYVSGVVLGLTVIFSYSLFFVHIKQPFLNRVHADVTRLLPYYNSLQSIMSPGKNNLFDMGRTPANNLMHNHKQNSFAYLSSPRCQSADHPLNLVIIVIDTWRFDMLRPDVMPFLSNFSKQTMQFTQHISGGDATGPGIFSLFYGIPSTYWASVSAQQQGPLFIDELLRKHYQMGIFSSATLKLPDLNHTVFSSIKGLQLDTQGETPDQRDKAITHNFKQFIKISRDNPHPFFSFLFYDAAHAYCEVKDVLKPFTPAINVCNRFSLTNDSDPVPYLNRYKNALLMVDQQIKEVIEALKKDKLLDNTVVLITGDHGEEFNDNHLGYWGHSSNFLRYQVQTPLIIYWPGMKAKSYAHKTSHYDIVPTIMNRLLNCKAASSEYSTGTSLWDTHPRSYLIVGSYIDFGIIEKDRVTTIYPSGNYDISQLDGKLIASAILRSSVINKVSLDLKRFYHISS